MERDDLGKSLNGLVDPYIAYIPLLNFLRVFKRTVRQSEVVGVIIKWASVVAMLRNQLCYPIGHILGDKFINGLNVKPLLSLQLVLFGKTDPTQMLLCIVLVALRKPVITSLKIRNNALLPIGGKTASFHPCEGLRSGAGDPHPIVSAPIDYCVHRLDHPFCCHQQATPGSTSVLSDHFPAKDH